MPHVRILGRGTKPQCPQTLLTGQGRSFATIQSRRDITTVARHGSAGNAKERKPGPEVDGTYTREAFNPPECKYIAMDSKIKASKINQMKESIPLTNKIR